MTETLTLACAWAEGGVLGALFFGGLWWTVRHGVSCKQPALWFLVSSLLRTSAAMAGFYFAAGGDWQRLLVCVLGFVMARPVVTWTTRPPRDAPGGSVREVTHASQSR